MTREARAAPWAAMCCGCCEWRPRAGASVVLAETTRDNIAALRLLRAGGATLATPGTEGHVRAKLPVADAR